MACIDTLPADLNISLYQGATFSLVLTWLTGNPPAAVNLTGYTAVMKIKTGGTTLVTLTTENGGIALGGTAGTITLTVSATATAALSPANGFYDLLLTSAGGIVYPLVAGLATIRAGVSG